MLGTYYASDDQHNPVITYLPALVFTVISLIAVYILVKEALCGGERTQ